MPNWIELDPSTLNRDERLNINGVEINVGMSPYDIPDRVGGYYDPEIQRFVIEFKYLDDDDEEKVVRQSDEDLAFVVGRHSDCLYEIRVDVDRLQADGVLLKMHHVEDAIQRLANDHRLSRKRRHYEVAREIISSNARELAAAGR